MNISLSSMEVVALLVDNEKMMMPKLPINFGQRAKSKLILINPRNRGI